MKIKLFASTEDNKKRFFSFYNKIDDGRFYFAIIPLIWCILFFVCPILIILKISFAEPLFQSPPFSEIFTFVSDKMLRINLDFSGYISIFKNSYYVSAFLNSLALSSVATLLCFFLGFSMAYGIFQVNEKKRSVLLLFVSLSFWTSFLIRIYAWINLFSAHGFVNKILINFHIIEFPFQFLGNYYAVCLGLVFCYLPFMIFPIYAVLEKFDKSYIEAAYDLGIHPAKAFWRIVIPLSKYGIITGSLLVFSTSIGEFVVPELLGGADTITFGRVIWAEFFNNLDWPMACALSIVMMLFVIFPVFLFQKSLKI